MIDDLTRNDVIILHKLYKLSNDILQELEIISRYEKLNKNANYNRLKSLLKEEKEFYDNLEFETIDAIDTFLNLNNIYYIQKGLNIAKDDNRMELIKCRIAIKISILFGYLSKEEEEEELTEYEEEEFLALEGDEYLDSYEFEDDDVDEEFSSDMDDFSIAFISDVLRLLWKNVDDYINNPEYSSIKDSLIDFKYRVSFLWDYLINEQVKNKFKCPKPFYLTMGFNDSFYNLTNELKKEMVETLIGNFIEEQDMDLSGIFFKMQNRKDYISLILTQIILRTVVVFIGDDLITEYNLRIASKNINSKAITDNIRKSFSNYEKDRESLNLVLIKRK